jgi:tellurite resistance protein
LTSSAQPVPPNAFGAGFGLAGLAECWVIACEQGHVPAWPGYALLALAAAVWLVTVAFYLRGVIAAPSRFVADVTSDVFGPFAALVVIVPLLLAAIGLAPHAPTAGKICVNIFLALTVLYGGWITGQWIYRPVDLDKMHPGYFLPTAAGGFVASAAASAVGEHRIAEVMLGYGIVCWLILGSMIMGRLFFRPLPPPPLLPTLAIEVAPAAVASVALFALNGGRIDLFASGLAGYGVLMVLAQIRLLPLYLKLSFGLGFWAFTFSWAGVAAATLFWINLERPPGQLVYMWIVLALITAFIGAIAVRSAMALARGNLLPPAPAAVTTG